VLPNFIIVGAPKAGTTSIYRYLSKHPEVFMSSPKEINYFSIDQIESQNLYYNYFKVKSLIEYEKLFDGVTNETAIGEGSVSYLFYKETPAKIKNIIPDVKIIILLREPISRAFSHYLMDNKLGLVNDSFENIIFKTSISDKQNLYYQQYVELGLYYKQIKRYFDIFNKNQIKICFQDDLYQNPLKVMNDIFIFLNIDCTHELDISRRFNAYSNPKSTIIRKFYQNNVLRNIIDSYTPSKLKWIIKKVFFDNSSKPNLSKETIDYLYNIYIKDIVYLEKLLNISLESWKK